jgi:hypothetical protein
VARPELAEEGQRSDNHEEGGQIVGLSVSPS